MTSSSPHFLGSLFPSLSCFSILYPTLELFTLDCHCCSPATKTSEAPLPLFEPRWRRLTPLLPLETWSTRRISALLSRCVSGSGVPLFKVCSLTEQGPLTVRKQYRARDGVGGRRQANSRKSLFFASSSSSGWHWPGVFHLRVGIHFPLIAVGRICEVWGAVAGNSESSC